MQEQQATTPQEVAQPSLDDRIAAAFGLGEEQPKVEEQQQQAPQEATSETDEPQIEDDSPPQEEPDTGFVEIKHNGQIKRVSKEQSVDLIQKGFDYESRMSENKAERQRLQSLATALQAQQALAAQSIEHIAEAKAYQRELKKFEATDWVKESQEDPVAAFQKRQQYDTLISGYNSAIERANHAAQQYQGAQQQVDASVVEANRKDLLDMVPQWRDQKVYDREWPEIAKMAQSAFRAETMQTLPTALLRDPGVSAVLRDAWKYRQAIAAQKAKRGDNSPQAPKPGIPQPRLTRTDIVRAGVKELHQAKDPSRKKELFDKVLEAKYGLK